MIEPIWRLQSRIQSPLSCCGMKNWRTISSLEDFFTFWVRMNNYKQSHTKRFSTKSNYQLGPLNTWKNGVVQRSAVVNQKKNYFQCLVAQIQYNYDLQIWSVVLYYFVPAKYLFLTIHVKNTFYFHQFIRSTNMHLKNPKFANNDLG